MLARQHSSAVDDAVCRNVLRAAVQRPTDHTGARLYTKISGDGAVAGYPSFWYQFCDLVDIAEEIVGRLRHF